MLPNEILLTTLMIIHLTKTFKMLIAWKSYSIILNWRHMYGEYMSYVWRMWEKESFNVMINAMPCTIIRQSHSVFCESCKICLWEETLSLCEAFVVCSKINVLNWLKFVPRELQVLSLLKDFFAFAGQSTFLQWTLKEVCLSKNWGDISQLQAKLP